MYVLGVDIGLSGAMVVLTADRPAVHAVLPMPLTAKGRGEMVDGGRITRWLFPIAEDLVGAVIEDQSSRPKQGVASSLKLGMSFGVVIGVFDALEIPYQFVSPRVWKSSFGLAANAEPSQRKRLALAKASQLFPAARAQFVGPRGGALDGIAEAALIGLYGLRSAVLPRLAGRDAQQQTAQAERAEPALPLPGAIEPSDVAARLRRALAPRRAPRLFSTAQKGV